MAREFRVKATIVAKDEASGPIGRVRGSFASLSTFIKNTFVVTLGDLVRIGQRVVAGLAGIVGAATESEDSFNKLAIALGRFGTEGPNLSKILNEQAAALQLVTRYSDETVRSAQTLLANMGLTAEQIPKATQAAVALAATFKINLSSAARDVGRSFSGTLGRSIRLFVPQLKELDEAALRSGGAVDELLKRFSGSAAKDAATFSGQLEILKNAFGELEETLGAAVTTNPLVKAAFASLFETISDSKTTSGLSTLVAGFIQLSASMVEVAAKTPAATAATASFIEGLFSLIPTFERSNEQLVENARAQAEWTAQLEADRATLGSWIDSIIALGEAHDKSATSAAAAIAVQAGVSTVLSEVGSTAASAASGVDALASANERAARITVELGTAQTAFVATLKAAGIVLRDFNKEQANLDTSVAGATLALRTGRIDAVQYADVLEQIAVKQAALTAEITGTTVALKDTTTGTKAAASGFLQLSAAQSGVAGALNRTASAASNAARAVSGLNQVLGVGRVLSRDNSDQSAVDAAVAAGFVPYLGGTRINLPGGGSRLVRVYN